MRHLAVEQPLWAFRDTCRAHEMFWKSARETLVTSVTIACLARWATWHATVNGKINRSKGNWDRLANLKSHLFSLPVSFTPFLLRFRGSFNVIFQSSRSGNCSVWVLNQKVTDKKTKIGCWQLSRRNSPITTSRHEIAASLRARFELATKIALTQHIKTSRCSLQHFCRTYINQYRPIIKYKFCLSRFLILLSNNFSSRTVWMTCSSHTEYKYLH